MNKEEVIDYLVKNGFEILLGNDDFNGFIMGEVYAEKRIELPNNNIFYIKFYKYNAHGLLGNKQHVCDFKKEFKWDVDYKCEDFVIISLLNFNTDKKEYKKILYDGYTIDDIDMVIKYILTDVINTIKNPIELVVQIKRCGKEETLFSGYVDDMNSVEKLINEFKINEQT